MPVFVQELQIKLAEVERRSALLIGRVCVPQPASRWKRQEKVWGRMILQDVGNPAPDVE